MILQNVGDTVFVTVCKFSQSAKFNLTFCRVENPIQIDSKMAGGGAAQVLDGSAGDNGSVPLIRNELLTFVSQKLNYMPTDSIVQLSLCVQFYDGGDRRCQSPRTRALCRQQWPVPTVSTPEGGQEEEGDNGGYCLPSPSIFRAHHTRCTVD